MLSAVHLFSTFLNHFDMFRKSVTMPGVCLTDCISHQVQLLGLSPTTVESVAVTINSDTFQHFTIFVIELLQGNKALYKPCSKFEVDKRILQYPCSYLMYQ